MNQENVYYATGRRKTAISRTWMTPGSGQVIINNRPVEEYFPIETTTGLSFFASTTSFQIISEASALPPGEFILKTIAFTDESCRALLTLPVLPRLLALRERHPVQASSPAYPARSALNPDR